MAVSHYAENRIRITTTASVQWRRWLHISFRGMCSPDAYVCWSKGTDLLWDPTRNEDSDKHHCLKRHIQTLSQATYPCAIAYSYARIRRLVRLGGGFYCGAVAECSVTGFSSPANFQGTLAPPLFMAACVGHLGAPGSLSLVC